MTFVPIANVLSTSFLLSAVRLLAPSSRGAGRPRSLLGSYEFHNAWNMSNYSGVKLPRDSTSETQSDASPSRYPLRYSHLATLVALITRLLSCIV